MRDELKEINYKVPYGRPFYKLGVDKYDDPDGVGLFKLEDSDETILFGITGSIRDGAYVSTGGKYTVSDKDREELDEYIDILENLLKERSMTRRGAGLYR